MVEPSDQDGFKWFGEGFEGFPKLLPEDSVEYIIRIIDTRSTDVQLRERLQAVQKHSNELSRSLLRDYIWQRDSFRLDLEREEGSWVLRGRTNYGDSVADEWLIVYLLRETSRKFSDAWIRVQDSDGEFLLIEAANTLPRWLNPEVASNRVWIHEGKLLVVPLFQAPSPSGKTEPLTKPLTTQEAILFISNNASKLMHSPLIEEEAFYRLRNYPSEIDNSLHTALVTIPRKLAYVLHENPSCISSAVESFYLRDPISLRPLNASTADKLHFPPTDFVTVSVRFNKVGFAQLYSQQYASPKSWEQYIHKSDDQTSSRRAEIGMKLTCGFEMLLSDQQVQDKRSVREIKILLEDLANGDNELPSDEEIQKWSQRDDDDSWLDIDFVDFEKELEGKGKSKNSTAFGDKRAQENLRKMVERFESFLNDDDAGADGAQGLDDMDIDDDESDLDASDISSEGEDKDLSFDEEEFVSLMKQMMGLPAESRGMDGVNKEEFASALNQLAEINPDEKSDSESDIDIEEINDLSRKMEDELRTSDALNLDASKMASGGRKAKAIVHHEHDIGKGKGKVDVDVDVDSDEEKEDEEIDIDYNLAKNLLESFKGQAGMAGPAGNMMGLMGLRMPRDEGEDDRSK